VTDRRFRFGLVSGWARSAAEWTRQASTAEQLGYSTLLVPDTVDTVAPVPACAVAATATSSLRVGSYVLATARRNPMSVAWEAAALDLLTDSRFELGLGAGRPAARQETERLGLVFGTVAERLRGLSDTIDAVRHRTPDLPVLVAGSGPRTLTLAAELADTVALGVRPDADERALEAAVTIVHTAAAGREPELNLNLVLVGDEVPAWLSPHVTDAIPSLTDKTSVAALGGSTQARCDTLKRRRDTLGISYITCPAAFATDLAPVVDLLAGA
jgi:alkanesulfonate monooxygenase SsuD/methylene tetrahydromethanopterin reductase-like flavin-dependent oxidoreductase (luciferase family)